MGGQRHHGAPKPSTLDKVALSCAHPLPEPQSLSVLSSRNIKPPLQKKRVTNAAGGKAVSSNPARRDPWPGPTSQHCTLRHYSSESMLHKASLVAPCSLFITAQESSHVWQELHGTSKACKWRCSVYLLGYGFHKGLHRCNHFPKLTEHLCMPLHVKYASI